jgi:TolB-like protein/Flp pilus assembly protein TadD
MSLIRFGEFELNEQTLELRRKGAPIRVQQQPARVLAFLLKHQGALVTRQQIQETIWGNETFVDFEQNLNFCIRQLRITLNDQADKPSFIETLPRLGYRFIGNAEKVDDIETAKRRNRIRIGVLPIDNLGGSTEDYFATGLSEDLISALSRIDREKLCVTVGPRLPSGILGTEQLENLKREFNLDFLLRGSIRRSADVVRITAQLVDLSDKSVLWSEVYDHKSSDLLAIQEQVTNRVSQSLALELLPGTSGGSRKYSRSSAAYDAYLKGRFFWHKMSTETIRRSIDYFNQALSLDHGFAPAYAGLADCYAQMGSVRVGLMKPLEALPLARSYLQKAFDLDQTMAEAHCTLGLIKSWYDLDWSGAEREFQVALALEPGQITALLWQSLSLAATGRKQDAVDSVKRAREIEPLSPSVNLYLGVALEHAGHYDLAIRQLQLSIELDPGYYRPYMFLGRSLCWQDRHDEAIAAHQKALSLRPDSIESLAFLGVAMAAKGDRKAALKLVDEVKLKGSQTEPEILIANIYARLGLANEMFESLERAFAVKSTPIYISVLSEEYLPYRTNPRFHSFLASIGLSQWART